MPNKEGQRKGIGDVAQAHHGKRQSKHVSPSSGTTWALGLKKGNTGPGLGAVGEGLHSQILLETFGLVGHYLSYASVRGSREVVITVIT
jgi:hypothetical protein